MKSAALQAITFDYLFFSRSFIDVAVYYLPFIVGTVYINSSRCYAASALYEAQRTPVYIYLHYICRLTT